MKKTEHKKCGHRSVMKASRAENIVLHILFLIMVVIFVYPILLVVGTSFADIDSINTYGYQILPHQTTLSAYKYAFNSGNIYVAYKNTILSTIIGTVLGVLLMVMYAYPISRKNFKHRKFFTFYAYFTVLFNGGTIPWYIVCTKFLHINNTFLALFLPSLINVWNIIVLRTFITSNIPDAIIESAKIDGCSEFGIFFRMVLPLSIAGTATISLFMALSFWNNYYLPMMLITEESLYNLQYYLQLIFLNISMLKNDQTGSMASFALEIPAETTRFAMCVLAMGPILFVYPFFQRYFVKGLTIGSVKG